MTRQMLFVLSIAIGFFLIFSLFGLYVSVRPPRIHSPVAPDHLGLPHQQVALHTSDGLRLRGWFIPNPGSQKAIIGLHGYPADKGDILPAISFLHRDYNLLVFDFRYFGGSDGSYTTAGAREVRDLLAAVRYLQENGIDEIGVWGFSMGGAVALMGSAQTGAIRTVVADSSYADLHLMARETYRHLFVLKYPLAFFTGIWAKIFLGVDPKAVSPAKAVRESRIPILLIHSEQDKVIPFLHGVKLREALRDNPNAEFWFTDNLAHGQQSREYEDRIGGFFRRTL